MKEIYNRAKWLREQVQRERAKMIMQLSSQKELTVDQIIDHEDVKLLYELEEYLGEFRQMYMSRYEDRKTVENDQDKRLTDFMAEAQYFLQFNEDPIIENIISYIIMKMIKKENRALKEINLYLHRYSRDND